MMKLDNLPGALPNEKIQGIFRRHWITLFSLFAILIVIIILPIASYLFLSFTDSSVLQNNTSLVLLILGGSAFFLFVILFLYQHFLDHWLDIWIVTNSRILNIEQKGLFARTISELRLYRVQDVTSEVNGFMRSLLNFGMVYIQTAGEKERFTFEDVHNPNKVSKLILTLAEQDRKEHLEEAIEAIDETSLDNKQHIVDAHLAPHLEP
ncbi:PH domain-containing protein [Patescibacteria group bacterium]|nr:PH domain-containing protein [Patescibacteria group bacterium]